MVNLIKFLTIIFISIEKWKNIFQNISQKLHTPGLTLTLIFFQMSHLLLLFRCNNQI